MPPGGRWRRAGEMAGVVVCKGDLAAARRVGPVRPGKASQITRQEAPVMMRYERCVIRPDRVRRVPSRFSWLDQRLVREGRLRGLSHAAHSVYLFLATVADNQGLSWYGDGRVTVELGMGSAQLETVRAELVAADLIAYRPPLYQVLELRPQAWPAIPAGVRRPEPAERPATPAEVRAMIQTAFGTVDR